MAPSLRLLLFFIIMGLPASVLAQAGGGPGWFSHLSPTTGPGTSVVSVANNANAIFLNPAGLKRVSRSEITLTHVPLWENASYSFVGVAIPSISNAFGIAYSQFNSGELTGRDQFGNETETFFDAYRVLALGFGSGIGSKFSFGLGIRGIDHEFMTEHTYGLGVDGGLIIGPIHGFRGGVRFMNVYADGYTGEHQNSLKAISPAYRYGFSYSALDDKLIVSLDLENSSDRHQYSFFGAEVRAHENFVFKLGTGSNGGTVGVGLNLKDLFLDFAFTEHPLGSLQYFSISHSFGKSVKIRQEEILAKKQSAEELYKVGVQMYENQQYEGALFQFQQALESWPEIRGKVSDLLTKTERIVDSFSKAEESYELNKYRLAITYAKQCVTIEPKHKKAAALLKKAETKWEKANEALKFYTQGLEYEKEGNISEAIQMWEKTLEIDSEHAGALAKLDEYKKQEPLRIEILELNDVFAAVYKYYTEHPIGRIKLINRDVLDLLDVKVSVMIRKYFDYPTEDSRMTIDTLAANSEQELPLYAIFNNRVLDLNVDTPVQAEIAISYQYRNRPVRHEMTSQLILHNRNAIRWQDPQKAAAFVTPGDPIIMNMINKVKNLRDPDIRKTMPSKLYDAMLIFDGLIASNVTYVPDPNNPYSEIKNLQAIDHLKYPRETLLHGGGDCDDLSVLYCSLLEAIGTKTALIDAPQHLFVMFDTEYPPEKAPLIHKDRSMIVIRDNSIWIPVEITALQEGFMEAWKIAARNYNKWSRL